MRRNASRVLRLMFCLIGIISSNLPGQQTIQPPQHLFFHVQLSPNFQQPVSGRLLVFIANGMGATEVDTDPFNPKAIYVAAKEVLHMTPGATVDVDTDDVIFPSPLSQGKTGDYQAQAVLDIDHSYNYLGRVSGDLISPVESLKNWSPANGNGPQLTLSSTVPARPLPLSKLSADQSAAFGKLLLPINFQSAALTRFWARPIKMRGWVLLPPSYSGSKTSYPTVYFTHGFGGNVEYLKREALEFYLRTAEKKFPDMIWVLLDESTPTGTHEFADSANNGPWGTALTTELIPYLEKSYRMDARPSGRFLQGHSSGGWATLWLQVTYPKVFGGTWSTSPDSSDFHDFTGPDLYAPHANVYYKSDGTAWPIIRNKGQVLATIKDFVKLEEVLGDPGGQWNSFDWVFSPRGPDGQPLKMSDRVTGDVDPNVIAYWRDHYDIAHIVSTNWKTLAPNLRGKIHLIVGAADTFYLDGAAHKLQAVLDDLQANARFTFIPDRTHFDLFKVGDDRLGLMNQITAEMYAIARPKVKQ